MEAPELEPIVEGPRVKPALSKSQKNMMTITRKKERAQSEPHPRKQREFALDEGTGSDEQRTDEGDCPVSDSPIRPSEVSELPASVVGFVEHDSGRNVFVAAPAELTSQIEDKTATVGVAMEVGPSGSAGQHPLFPSIDEAARTSRNPQ